MSSTSTVIARALTSGPSLEDVSAAFCAAATEITGAPATLHIRENGRWAPELVADATATAIPLHDDAQTVAMLVLHGTDHHPAHAGQHLDMLARHGSATIRRSQQYDQLVQAVGMTRGVDSLKADFLANAQHELRTPVMLVMGRLELLYANWQRWDDAMRHNLVAGADQDVRHLADVVDTILEFSMIDHTIEALPSTVSVHAAVMAAIAGLRSVTPVLRSEIEVNVDPALTVWAEPRRLVKAIRAILDNALKFGAGRPIDVAAAPATDPTMVSITVVDHGAGIPARVLDSVFEAFYQVDSSRTRKNGGSGLGLALARKICAMHGAQAFLHSVEGQGTTVELHWPAVPEGRTHPDCNEVDAHSLVASTPPPPQQ